ncbi:MAG: GntR family transcriptional regulator [Oculatellaceae cyanobacterium bins.114]|nr:GntR family transcriptional regulator [Oculatellaceae cyanobacterium bins.114]
MKDQKPSLNTVSPGIVPPSIVPQSIVPQSLDCQVADVLREQILKGHYPPGFRLKETNLADQFKLSRGTIRSALQQLTYEGLITQVLHKGWTVTTLSLNDIWELHTLRTALESLASRLVAETLTDEKIEMLKHALAALTQAVQGGDLKKITDADFQLHKTIVQLSDHSRLQAQYKLIEQQIHLCIAYTDTLFPDLSVITAEHEQLVESICSGDGSLAEQTARQHNADGKVFTRHLQMMSNE